MKQNVIVSIQGKQFYEDQEPEVIELITEGTLEKTDDGWLISYEESALTGMEGVTTTFLVEPDRIVLTRSGALRSQMVFQLGVLHESLYQLEFGALMISVCAKLIEYELSENGGIVDLVYAIDIEHTGGGLIDYHLEIRPTA